MARNSYFNSKEQAQRISKNTEEAYTTVYSMDNILITAINKKDDLLPIVNTLASYYTKEEIYLALLKISEKYEDDDDNINDCLDILSGYHNQYLGFTQGVGFELDYEQIKKDFENGKINDKKFEEQYLCTWKNEE